MTGTVIQIPGINVDVIPIDLEGSTDKSYLMKISDINKDIVIEISYGKITNIHEKICSSKHNK